MPAVLGGQVSVGINPLSSTAPYIDAGTVRVLPVSSAERLPSLDAPTLREQGLDIEFENWRGLVAPPNISATGRRRLEAAIETLAHSREWRDTLARYRWNDRFLSGPAFARFLAADEAQVRDMVRRFGSLATESSPRMGRYPVFVLTALAVVSLAFAIQLHRSRGAAVERAGAGWRAVWLIAAGIVVDLMFVERLGFILAAAGLFWMTARAFDRAHPLRDAGWAVALSVAAYFVFARLLELPLPAGVLERWL